MSKPDPGFFRRVIAEAPGRPDEILYVGDRLDNDIRPADLLGLKTARIHRGPWALLQHTDPDAHHLPTLHIDSLSDLPGKIGAVNSAPG